ncbi:heat shock protein 70 family protein, partial [Kipferlia bialata]
YIILYMTGVHPLECCIAVPGYFNQAQRVAVQSAVSIAGLKPLRVMSSHGATSFNYGIRKLKEIHALGEGESFITAFVNVGESQAYCTIVKYTNGNAEVLGVQYDQELGGRNYDDIIVRHFAEVFKTKNKVDIYESKRGPVRVA